MAERQIGWDREVEDVPSNLMNQPNTHALTEWLWSFGRKGDELI